VLCTPARRSRFPRSTLALLALAAAGASGCADHETAGSSSAPVVYGEDDREDVYAFADQAWAAQANGFSAALMSLSSLDLSDPTDVGLPPGTLEDAGICPDERFADQMAAGFCSATLIAPDLILTAGHCISESDCADSAFVFDYSMTDEATLQTITADDVYSCQEVLVNLVSDSDYAVVRLDREVAGRTPATVNVSGAALPAAQPLVVNGYPSGLPLKIDDGANVRDPRAATLDYFVANLDTFGGNSGSGVFDNASKQLVGILVRGEQDYVNDPAGCARVNVCPNDGCSGEDSTYAFRAIEDLCASGAPASGLCACGDGTCDAEGGETTATCPLDCGTECGDGACNGDESPNNCTEDCGTCGNGVCDGSDTQDSCCSDCGCADEGEVCLANECVADPGPGDSCSAALEIAAEGTQSVTGDNLLAQDDFSGSCIFGAGGLDRVYTFTLTGTTEVDAISSGFDTGLYLRSTCDDAESELACDDDIDFPENPGSQVTQTLAAGTYFLIIDGFNDEAVGSYTIDVTFTPVCPGGECGEPDAGAPDPDAGPADAGSADASPLDASSPQVDAAPSDAASPDAGPADAATGGGDDDGQGDSDDGDDGDDHGDDDDDDDEGDDDGGGCNAAGSGTSGGGLAFSLGLVLAILGMRRRSLAIRAR